MSSHFNLFLLPMCVYNSFLSVSHHVSTSPCFSLGLSQIEEEFRRITLKPLQSTFLGKLDQYTPKLLSLYRRKGWAVGKKLDETLDMLNEACIYKSVVVVSFKKLPSDICNLIFYINLIFVILMSNLISYFWRTATLSPEEKLWSEASLSTLVKTLES